MRLNRERAMHFVFGSEGDHYHNVKGDAGGPTSAYGLTLATAKQFNLDLDHDGDVDIADLKMVTWEDVERIFNKYFWDAIDGDNLPGGVDLIAADIAWNSGPGRFKKFQRTGLDMTPEMLTEARINFYNSIVKVKPSQVKFLKGWLNRANRALEESKKCEV